MRRIVRGYKKYNKCRFKNVVDCYWSKWAQIRCICTTLKITAIVHVSDAFSTLEYPTDFWLKKTNANWVKKFHSLWWQGRTKETSICQSTNTNSIYNVSKILLWVNFKNTLASSGPPFGLPKTFKERFGSVRAIVMNSSDHL